MQLFNNTVPKCSTCELQQTVQQGPGLMSLYSKQISNVSALYKVCLQCMLCLVQHIRSTTGGLHWRHSMFDIVLSTSDQQCSAVCIDNQVWTKILGVMVRSWSCFEFYKPLFRNHPNCVHAVMMISGMPVKRIGFL